MMKKSETRRNNLLMQAWEVPHKNDSMPLTDSMQLTWPHTWQSTQLTGLYMTVLTSHTWQSTLLAWLYMTLWTSHSWLKPHNWPNSMWPTRLHTPDLIHTTDLTLHDWPDNPHNWPDSWLSWLYTHDIIHTTDLTLHDWPDSTHLT